VIGGRLSVVSADVFEADLPLGEARLVYADPPYTDEDYLGYGGAPGWERLIARMLELGAADSSFVLHCGSPGLPAVLPLVERLAPKRTQNFPGQPKARILAWVKPWGPKRPNVGFQYWWEPVVVFYGSSYRAPGQSLRQTDPDWIMTPPLRGQNRTPTQKPGLLLFWLFNRLLAGARDRVAIDLFSGSGQAALMAAHFGLHALAVERDEALCELIRQRAGEALDVAALELLTMPPQSAGAGFEGWPLEAGALGLGKHWLPARGER